MKTANVNSSKVLPSWAFEFKNIGCLKSGSLIVKPITILCGKNNTGKTWVMYSIYGFLNTSQPNVRLPKTAEITKELKVQGTYELKLDDWIEENYLSIKKDFDKDSQKMLEEVFNTNDTTIFSKSQFSWVVEKESLIRHVKSKSMHFTLTLGTSKKEIINIEKDSDESVLKLTLLDVEFPQVERFINHTLVQLLQLEHDRSPAFLIPAERNGLHLFFNELSSRRTALLHHASKESFDLNSLLKDVLKSKYSAPIANYIDWLNELKTKRKEKSTDFHSAAEEIKKIISGKYTVDNEGQIYFSTYKKGKEESKKLELHLSSSTVKSLFGLWFYLEHQAEVGDILMIDEPELNLHPANQRIIARFLAKLSNSGLRIIVSTHSDYFLKEINSLIMLSSAKNTIKRDAVMKKQGIDASALVDENNVAAYLFEQNTISEMEKSVEGINALTFDRVIDSINEDNDEIYFSLINSPDDEAPTSDDVKTSLVEKNN